jgi:hypothetical protein
MMLRVLTGLLLLLPLVGCGGSVPVDNRPAPDPALRSSQPAKKPADLDPEPDPGPDPEPVAQIDADYVAFEGGLKAFPQRKVVEMEAWLLGSQTRALEYLLVNPGGNTHESLFLTGATGLHLKRALEIIGLQEGEVKRVGRGYPDKPLGDRVKMSVRFRHAKSGEMATVPVEDWLWNVRTEATFKESGFIFTGSFEQYRPELNRSLFEADMKGNLIALWRDASCVLDNDREDAYVPDIYSPYPDADGIPAANRGQTPPVTLIFEPWPEPKDD